MRPPDAPQPPTIYAAFDRFPAPKGAARHIAVMAQTLFDVAGGGLLYALGGAGLPRYQREGGVEIVRFEAAIPNLLHRAHAFGAQLQAVLDTIGPGLRLAHVRDPWGGMPLLLCERRRYATIYEINGLPSIELPHTYPRLAPATLAKLREIERRCWEAADVLIAPSDTMASNLVKLGAPQDKLHVIPNGAELTASQPPPPEAPEHYLLYLGALQPWQGLEVLLRALALLRDLQDLRLVIICPARNTAAKRLRQQARALGIADRLVWHFGMQQAQLAPWLANATLAIAPLTACARNLEQGCCPLKVLEALGAGVPVVASDLPAVREIVRDGVEGRLVPPDRPEELARAIRVLLEYPELRRTMGQRGRERITSGWSWERSRRRLAELYTTLLDRTEEL